LKSVPATQFRAGRQQAATSRARAPRVALGPPPETLLPHVRASPSPGASLDAVRRRVRAVRAERATDRSDSVAAAVRAATEDGYHGGFFVVSAPSSSSTYLRAARSRARQRTVILEHLFKGCPLPRTPAELPSPPPRPPLPPPP
jgi:hypothetical protein